MDGAQGPSGGTATVIQYDYEAVRRLTKQKVTTVGTGVDDYVRSVKYAYDDANGWLMSVGSYGSSDCTTDLRNEVAYAYNGLGMLTTEYQDHAAAAGPGDPNVRYDPDDTAAGGEYTDGMRLKRLRYPNGRYVHTTYGDGDANDVLSRVAAIKNDNGGSPGATTFAAYSYDGAGRVVVEDYAQPDVRLDRVDLATWATTPGTYAGLDRFGRIKQQWWRDYGAAADVDKLAYGYDRNSNRLYRENVVSGSQGTPVHLDELYHYDRLNRLQDANRGDLNGSYNAVSSTSLRQAWTLDDLGNWSAFQTDTDGNAPWGLDHSREHNQANEIADTSGNSDAIETTTGTDWANPAHDARGNMTTVPKPNDPANAYTCTYDAWNRLVKVADGATTVAEYRYDGLHRRIARLVPDGANWDRTDFYYTRGWQVLEERFADAQPDNDTVAAAAKYQYVWSLRYIDACILRDEDKDADGNCVDAEGAGGSERLYYASGANMEVTAVVSTSGAVRERYTYTPYGQVTIHDDDWSDTIPWTNSKHNEILYSGYRYDGESGLYHVRFRMYHPVLGRWHQRDPLEYADGMGLSEYVRSSSLDSRDYLGLSSGYTSPFGSFLRVVPPTQLDELLDDPRYTDWHVSDKIDLPTMLRGTGINTPYWVLMFGPGLCSPDCPEKAKCSLVSNSTYLRDS